MKKNSVSGRTLSRVILRDKFDQCFSPLTKNVSEIKLIMQVIRKYITWIKQIT